MMGLIMTLETLGGKKGIVKNVGEKRYNYVVD